MITDGDIVKAFETLEAETVKVDAKGRRYWLAEDDNRALLRRAAERLGVSYEEARAAVLNSMFGRS